MKYITYAIIFLYVIIPLQFALNPAATVDLAIVRVIILLISISYIALSLMRRSFYIPLGIISFLVTAFLMFIIFSLFFSPVPEWTLRKILFFYSFFPLFYILAGVFHNHPSTQYKIMQAIIYSGLIASCISLFQFFLQFFIPLNTLLSVWSHISPFFLGGSFSHAVITYNSWLVHVGGHDLMRAVAFFPDPHMLSFYLGMIIPLPIIFFSITSSKRWLMIFLIIFIADLLTFSRGGYIGLSVGVLFGLILMWNRVSQKIKHFVTLLALTIFLIFLLPGNPISQRFLSSFGLADTSSSHRLTLWTQAIDNIEQRPLLGTGLGAYAYIVSPHTDYRTPIYVHNLYLDIFVELGLVGVIIFFGLFIRLAIVLLRQTYNQFVIISIVIYLTHSFFDTAIFSVHILPILIFFFALGSHYENHTTIK